MVLVRFTPPLPEPVTVMSSKVLRAQVGGARGVREPCALAVVIEIVAGGREDHGAGVVEPHARGAVGGDAWRLETLNVPVVRVQLEPGLGAGRAGVDDVDVVDGAPLMSPRAAGDAAAGPAGVDVEAADLVAVVEPDHVGVGRRQRRVRACVGGVQRLAGEDAAAVGVDGQALVLADQALAGVHGVAVAAVAGAVLSPSNTNTVWLAAGRGLGLGERVERRESRCRCCRAGRCCCTYQTQPARAIVTWPVSVPGSGRAAGRSRV